ncbi:GNAT family N-acetyltransferase [Shewanella fidelis]|uniref:GNAT family N-acetyltransferase n=1 Tax=Shewanella fidelis TaxID=173509 RepID=A0AAW8NT93_9GAMM|nr:GNAT family N-acetyltransferase [Shewanella fidelis]MDR8524808.1 GNAT family N-acetyltransferase [Shewanella fidelis]MDW4810879.1 GNAT family N-acetyltransferase [Shewanella fidelis]MDW4815342.1 GNAT family N-acetyltransferase [Shewanella fidelis]MDW4819432.1 GNAT family N-acetyltransferase [Shewanella fidelis]MDW4822890.1 GNAT family N-acetyltransferase [Shewanella fidelis]
MEILLGQLQHPLVLSLLAEHHQDMALHSPPESVHALDVSGLAAKEVTFWSVWQNNQQHVSFQAEQLAGCGALKELDLTHGEIKSMRTASQFLRQGVAQMLLNHIIAEARNRGYNKLSLETGSMAAFLPAKRLYEQFGFIECEPFADYKTDPYSVFMTLTL